MSEFEKQKVTIISQLKSLCAHCKNNIRHSCRMESITFEVEKLNGVPLIVNDRFNGVFFK